MSEWCPNCGNSTPRLNNYTGWCQKCSNSDPYIQLERYLEENADHIEYYMAQGHSFSSAIALVKSSTRPSCLTCGAVMNRAPRDAIFCSKHERCRKAANRYKYLYKRKGHTKSAALAIIIREYSPSS